MRVERAEIVAEDLDRQVRLDAGNGFVDAHGHGLREVVGDAGNRIQFLVERRNQRFLGVKSRPGLHRAQQQVGVAFVDAHGFGGEVRPADLDHHVGDFRKLPQPLLDPLADLDRFGQRHARQLARLHQDRSFVELAA